MYVRFVRILILLAVIGISGCKSPDDERIQSADVLFDRAVQYTDRGRYDEAATAFVNLIEVDTDLGRTERVSQHQRHLGIIAENRGRFDEARSWYSRSIETARRGASHEGILEGMNRIALLAAITGDSRGEYSQYHDALTYTKFFNYPRGEALTSLYLGNYEVRNGRFEIAYGYFNRAVQIASTLNEPPLHYGTLVTLAEHYIRQGHYNEAYNRLREAERLERHIDDRVERIRFMLISGQLYEQTGRFTEAFSLYEKGWNTYRDQPRNNETFMRLLEAVADGYLMHGRYRDALSYFNMLADLTRDYDRQITHGYAMLGQSDGFLKFGIVVQNDDYINQAIQIARNAETHFGHMQYFTGQAYAVFQQARGASLLGRTDEAVRLYTNALSYLTETITSEGVFHSQERFEHRNNLENPRTAITNFLVNELMQARRYDDAFVYAERDRQSMLNEKVLRIGLTSSEEQTAELADSLTGLYRKLQGLDYARLQTYEQSQKLMQQRDTLQSQIITTRETIGILQNRLLDSLPNSRHLFARDFPSRHAIQQAVPGGRTLISYYATHTHLHTFILTRGALRVHSQAVPREILESRVENFQRLISSSLLFASEQSTIDRAVQREYNELSDWLYTIFINPVRSLTENLQHVIFVMPTGMHDLPLHALREPRGRRDYLVNRFRISYLPSSTVLTFRLQPPRQVTSIAAFGNPDGTDWNVDYEIRDVRGIFRNARLHLEANASIGRLKAERGDILHLTSEFFFQPNFPEHSHFLLTQDGTIAVRQFGLQHLTGLHQYPNVILYNSGDVIEGLNVIHPYLLYLNGSRSIIVNYWTREPRSAKWFNENVYSNLSIAYSYIEAYHEAQKTLISTPEFAHPHYWASFFLYSP
jgi:CHAT domain-containing protein